MSEVTTVYCDWCKVETDRGGIDLSNPLKGGYKGCDKPTFSIDKVVCTTWQYQRHVDHGIECGWDKDKGQHHICKECLIKELTK